MNLRVFTFLVSLALHGAAAAAFLLVPGGASLEEGTGSDTFIVEQGVFSERVEAVEAPPQVVQSTPPMEEIKPVEEDVQHVVGSEAGPEQEKVVLEPKPDEVKEPQKQQIAAVQQTEVPVEEKKAAGEKKSGGDTTAYSAYRGKIFDRISSRKFNPRSRETGTVVVRFTVSPDGTLISREIETSSGSKALDEAAVASIDRAAPFPPMPSDIKNEPLVVTVPFKFKVR